MIDSRHPRDIAEVDLFCKRIHDCLISRRSDKATIGCMAVLLEQGFSIRQGRHGIMMVSETAARLYVMPNTDKPGTIGIIPGDRSLKAFKARAVAVETVSALAESPYHSVPVVDYYGIAERFFRTWTADSDRLLNRKGLTATAV